MTIEETAAMSAYRDEIESLQATIVGMREQAEFVREAMRHLETERKGLEALRPVWAQGWTTEGRAAQASGSALAQIWEFLEVTNQTDAMRKLRAMK